MKINVLIAVLLFVLTVGCHKSSDDEDTLSFEEIKNQITDAEDGDTIHIPAGIYSITSQIVINKNITIKGAGIDKTKLICNIAANPQYPNSPQYAIAITGNDAMPNDKFRITGIDFEGTDISSTSKTIFFSIKGTCMKFRIDNCKFANIAYASIYIKAYTYGVIDHCEFTDAGNQPVVVGEASPGDASWNRPLSLGTENAVYIEDCVFNFVAIALGCFIEGDCGGRYVFRYNSLNSATSLNSCFIDAHGIWNSGERGTRSIEVYNNVLNSGHSYYGMYIRGGAGVIFNNTFNGDFTRPITLTNLRAFNSSATWNPSWGDVNTDKIKDLYIWNNSYNGNNDIDEWIYPDAAYTLVKDTDYYRNAPSSYIPYTYPHPLTLE
jgi:hypothetical protein